VPWGSKIGVGLGLRHSHRRDVARARAHKPAGSLDDSEQMHQPRCRFAVCKAGLPGQGLLGERVVV
jgi:hypothetical protein